MQQRIEAHSLDVDDPGGLFRKAAHHVAGGVVIEGHFAAKEVSRIEAAEKEIGIGHGRFGAAASITGGAGHRTGASRSDVEPALIVEPGDRAAADANFENVGGRIFHAVFARLNNFGRVAFCGAISEYQDKEPMAGPAKMFSIVQKRLTLQGFIISDHVGLMGDFVREVGAPVALGIHDRVYSDVGLDMVAAHMGNLLHDGQVFERREPGQDL